MAGSCSRVASSWSSASSARAMTRSVKRSAQASRRGAGAAAGMSEPAAAVNGNGTTPVKEKAGRHREATLYQALAGAGAGDGRSLEQLREAALKTFEASELPVWRRSGFWTTSLESLDFDALEDSVIESGVPEVVTRTLPERARAGRIVQSAGAIVSVDLDPALAEKGVILCSLEEAFERHPELASAGEHKRLAS